MSGPWERYAQPAPAPQPESGPWTQFAPGDSRGAVEQIAGAAGQFGAGFNRRLADVAGALPNLYDAGLQAVGLPRLFGNEQATASDRIYSGINSIVGTPPAPQTTTERFARGAGSGLVDAAATFVPAARIASATAPAAGAAPTMANRLATALAGQPGMQAAAGMIGGGVGDATESPVAGLAAALAVPAVAGAVGRAVTPIRPQPNPQREALVRAAEAEGIPVRAGQATGNRFLQNVESQLEQLPFTAGPARAEREAAEAAFIRAAWRRAGQSASDTTPDTLRAARDRIGPAIGNIANRNTMQFTPALDAELAQIEGSLRFIPAEAAAPVRARIEQLRGMVIQPPAPPPGSAVPAGTQLPNPTIPGASYRMMDSALGRSMRSTSNGDLRAALGDLRERLRRAMDASISPQDAAEWNRLRREYANYKVIERAAGRAGEGAAEGRMSPVALRGALEQSMSDGSYALGQGDLNTLARIGQGVLRPPPDSGTAGRTMANNLLTGGGLASGGAGVGAMVGGPAGAAIGAGTSLMLPRLVQALMNSDAGQAYLRNQVMPNPQLTAPLAAALLAQQGVSNAVGSRP